MPNTRIKMIDTDIDDIDDIDLDVQASHNNLARLYEDNRDQEMPPPSFNTAVRTKAETRANNQSYQPHSQYQDNMHANANVQR